MRLDKESLDRAIAVLRPKGYGGHSVQSDPFDGGFRLTFFGECRAFTAHVGAQELRAVGYDGHAEVYRLLKDRIAYALLLYEGGPRPAFRIGLRSPKRLQASP